MRGVDVLAGRRILVAEDEAPISLMLEAMLAEHGVEVVGPAFSVAEAKALINQHKIDCGVLDVRLGNEMVYPVADILLALAIPIVFVSGCTAIDLRYACVPRVEKPFAREDLERSIVEAISGRARPLEKSAMPGPQTSTAADVV